MTACFKVIKSHTSEMEKQRKCRPLSSVSNRRIIIIFLLSVDMIPSGFTNYYEKLLLLLLLLLWLSSTLVEQKPLCFASVLSSSSSFLFQKVISEVTERIPFILSRNIRSWCNLISHLQNLANLHPTEKSTKNPPKCALPRPSPTLDGE